MKSKPIILYDLREKTQVEKVQINRELCGYRDKSNYEYTYFRKGSLNNIKFSKEKKIVLKLENKHDLIKVKKIFKELKVNFEVVRT